MSDASGLRVAGPFEEGEWRAWDVEIEPGWKAFAGHFPERPILPAIGHLFLVRQLLATADGRRAAITSIDRFRILRPILPGATLRVRIEWKASDARARFTIDDAGRRVSEASFQWELGLR